MNAIMEQLAGGSQPSIKKRAGNAMGSFAVILNNAQLTELCTMLLTKIGENADKEATITLVQCLSLMAKATGTKLAPFLPQLVPQLTTLMKAVPADASEDLDNELSEACLSTLEALSRRCPKEISKYIP